MEGIVCLRAEHVGLFGEFRLLWSSTDTQLLSLDPESSLHVKVATPWETVSPKPAKTS